MTKLDLSRPPRRGAFDYLLEPIRDEVPQAPPPPPKLPEPPRRPQPIHINIEINARAPQQAPQKPGRRLGVLTNLLLAVLVAVACSALWGCSKAHAAQPVPAACSAMAERLVPAAVAAMAKNGNAVTPDAARLLLADDYWGWLRGDQAAVDWTPCQPVQSSPSDRWVAERQTWVHWAQCARELWGNDGIVEREWTTFARSDGHCLRHTPTDPSIPLPKSVREGWDD
jgi:hypothetical protein